MSTSSEFHLISKIKDWWESDQNPQKDNSFKRMALPIRNDSIVSREFTTENVGYLATMNGWPKLVSSRFILKSGEQFRQLHCVDMYHGREKNIQIENRSLTETNIEECLGLSTFEFIDEKDPRFAVCIFYQELQTFLSILEFDLVAGKLIVHQMLNLNIEDQQMFPNYSHIYIDRKAILMGIPTTHRFKVNFRRPYTFYGKFNLSIRDKNESPLIVQIEADTGFHDYCFAIINQKAYKLNVLNYNNPYLEADKIRIKYDELVVTELNAPLDIDGKYPRTIVKIQDFKKEYKNKRDVQTSCFGTKLYYTYRDTPQFDVVIVDLENCTWISSFRIHCISPNKLTFTKFDVGENELMLNFVENYNGNPNPHEAKLYTNYLFPIRRPFLLVKLAIFSVKRFNSVNPTTNKILKNMHLSFDLNPIAGYVECKSVHDEEFIHYCSN